MLKPLAFILLPISAAAQDATALAVVAPEQTRIARHLVTVGRAEALAQVDLVARVAGTLIAVPVANGARVDAGDTLFRIDPAPYEADVDAARAAVAGAEAQLAFAEADLKRQQELAERQVNAGVELDSARASREAARADLDSARAALRTAEITLGYTTITAPFEGVMSARQADPGAYVGAAGAEVLATLVSTGPLDIAFSVSEADLAGLRAAIDATDGPLPVEVGTNGGTDYPMTARLDYLAPTLSSDLGTLALRARLEAPDGVTPGATLRLRVPLGVPEPRLLLPAAAIGTDLEGRHVFTIAEGRIRRHAVQVEGGPVDGLVPVTGEIDPATPVVANIAAAPPAGSPAQAAE